MESTDKQKNEFLAILGHELRNPLASLKAGVELLDMDMYPPEKVIQIMERSVSSIAHLLDDLLDLSRISRNKINLKLNTLNVYNHLNNCLIIISHQINEKNQTLTTDIEKDLYIKADAVRLEQIFFNILTNANKYTPEGGRIEVSSWAEGDHIHIKIQDNGIGISKDQQEAIFEDFYQIEQQNKAASGLGIGLALVKQLVTMHYGQVQVHSDGPGKGSSFEVILPAIAQPQQEHKSSMSVHLSEDAKKDVTIVLIEDNEDITIAMTMILEHLNCEVFTAFNGSQGIPLIQEKKPDLAFVDIGLPDISGYEIAKQLRSKSYNGTLLALSGYSHDSARKQSEESGFDEHVAKPIGKEDLVDIFKKHIWQK
ncbi:hybrid sensor histidine kinase/response regulator [Fulvivirga maritima]|uniref:hybrid sensor histidine kinase/response regulator n=1 Tax=Fulvivirga maritima TaxID=2904247 RepID=UPI001F2BF737|nr:hybrid sensor histidine kinase/response regulator [Fulvivirga maritima]UII25784.1 hybrid sensor histidine kinase/response regulator [Fulvivirga maritima]